MVMLAFACTSAVSKEGRKLIPSQATSFLIHKLKEKLISRRRGMAQQMDELKELKQNKTESRRHKFQMTLYIFNMKLSGLFCVSSDIYIVFKIFLNFLLNLKDNYYMCGVEGYRIRNA